jgi:threonine dehydratase
MLFMPEGAMTVIATLPPADPSPSHRIRLADVIGAPARIDPVFLGSPQYECEDLSQVLGCRMSLKVETANPIRSFKGRGACVLVAGLQGGLERPIVGASAGNWGQALAFACRAARRKLILYASVNANQLKVDRMRALGAEVRLAGEDFDAAKLAAQAFAAGAGLRMVADGLDVEASIGAATMAVEMLETGEQPEAVLVPLGNGAMLTGVGRWFKAASPGTKVYGVSAAGADAMEKSWRTGAIVRPAAIATVADGIGVRIPVPEALEDMRDTVDEVLLVDDAAIIDAMRLLHRRAGLVVEPSGAAGLAAAAAYPALFAGGRVSTIICGGNLTDAQMAEWLG